LTANENEMNALADRMARAYEQGDLDGVASCYAPEAILWHNFDGSEQTVSEQLDATRWLGENLKVLKYERDCARRAGHAARRVPRQRPPRPAADRLIA
jgi:predicted nucleic acid-binding protein